jgi:hypothetical protein
MKPTVQINHKQCGLRLVSEERRRHKSFPLTDYNYRPTSEAAETIPTLDRQTIESPGFYKLSSEFLAAETSRDYAAELSFFVLITGIAAWPIVSMLIAVVRMIRNY